MGHKEHVKERAGILLQPLLPFKPDRQRYYFIYKPTFLSGCFFFLLSNLSIKLSDILGEQECAASIVGAVSGYSGPLLQYARFHIITRWGSSSHFVDLC